MRVLLGAFLLSFACLYALAVERVRSFLHLPTRDNCFTWAWRNFDYWAGDGLNVAKSCSGWFPHVSVVKGMQDMDRMQIRIIEYVPIMRVPRMVSPPHKLKGRVRTQRFVAL